ncbi:fimbria/pilus periplasmic chaperone [Klebsiella sp. RHBSTW-00215]|uniref:fimbria/pilus periplasmic chaperone n=1 Tax=Klebsiella sp. RHBSTW-00215 TaxID=2742640 RepID=UPI0015F4CB50|nr:fimbria/pilus periplasmic chaperone [Klebsiella sp. RHBSTW-00215]MBA7931909.1 fimbria/pilus periplasmic chaperone [Klebsiella sp. RHBSTW-00215]
MIKKTIQILSLLLAMSGIINLAHAGGIALGATRVIYPQGSKQVSLPVINSSDSNVFLIQSWVANADGSRTSDFIITPPLFVIQPKKENTLRIMYVGPSLPTDRESVFYLNSKAIPSVDKTTLAKNSLQIATQSVIKLFIRPKDLPVPSADAPAMLRCHSQNGRLTVANPSPYYVSLVEIHAGNQKLPNTMVAPKSELTLKSSENRAIFQTVNDFGATTPVQTCQSY